MIRMALFAVLLLGAFLPVAFRVAWGNGDGTLSAQPSPPQSDQLIDELGCAACHAGLPAGTGTIRARAPNLGAAAYDPAFVFEYLRNPARLRGDIGGSRMPSFHLDEREALAITLFLETLASNSGPPADGLVRNVSREMARALDRARDEHDDVTPERGEQIVGALNCAGCHADVGVPAVIGPPLLGVGDRMQEAWLRGYLSEPVPVRPFGFHPGSGGRMPDFSLTSGEVDAIATLLGDLPSPNPVTEYTPTALSPFSQDKALRYVRDRFPCLGCHALAGDGGRIAPDLALAGARLEPGYIRAMIGDPSRAFPGTVMPRHVMQDDRVDLLADFLSAENGTGAVGTYMSLVETPLRARVVDERSGSALYAKYCAMCHGANGLGDGYNAPYLPVPPTNHADSAYMSTRPDDTLFDGVHAGGYILNRSHRMPSFGQRLTSEQVRALVAYMRELCRCQGPAWSRDGRGQ